jgi:hypothetical protein
LDLEGSTPLNIRHSQHMLRVISQLRCIFLQLLEQTYISLCRYGQSDCQLAEFGSENVGETLRRDAVSSYEHPEYLFFQRNPVGQARWAYESWLQRASTSTDH